MKTLIGRIDQVIAGIGKLSRREAFGELEAVFRMLKEQGPNEAELKRFFDMVTLILLVYPRGMTIRISGLKQAAHARDERLEFNDLYEAALERTMDFLARNFLNHLDEYEPQAYLRAALRTLAKEYSRARAQERESVSVDVILERAEPDGAATREPARDDAPAWLKGYEYVRDDKPDGEIFYDWFVGDLSRRELSCLYRLTRSQVNQAILRIARTVFEQGRLYPLVSSLVRMEENGDIFWLSLKGLTAEQIGEKVALNHWVVYKRLDTVRRKFARLKALGEAGRQFGAWFCGMKPDAITQASVRAVLDAQGEEIGLDATEFAAGRA